MVNLCRVVEAKDGKAQEMYHSGFRLLKVSGRAGLYAEMLVSYFRGVEQSIGKCRVEQSIAKRGSIAK